MNTDRPFFSYKYNNASASALFKTRGQFCLCEIEQVVDLVRRVFSVLWVFGSTLRFEISSSFLSFLSSDARRKKNYGN
jgi:hypothetical protein